MILTQSIILVVDIALLIYLGINCYRVQKILKRADKLIEEMERELEGSGEDETSDREK